MTSKAKQQDQSQQQECQAKGDPQHSSSETHRHAHIILNPLGTSRPSAVPFRAINVMKVLMYSTSDLQSIYIKQQNCGLYSSILCVSHNAVMFMYHFS